MKIIDELTQYLTEDNFTMDELGRIVIDDQDLLAEINGAFSSGEAFSSSLINGACSNGSC